MNRPTNRIAYFGKIAARSDFIKAADDIPLMGVLDDWLAQVMAELPADARWKLNYDALAPVHFAFIGPRRKHAIAGHIVASRDQSGRRYPFMMMRTIDVADPGAFAAQCPLALAPLWTGMDQLARAVMAYAEPGAQLQAINDAQIPLDTSCAVALATFMATSTISSLSALLGGIDAKQLILALGMLLQPVLDSGFGDLDKSLVLPLPAQPLARFAVAAFWLELITPFLGHADVELALFVTMLEGRAVLVVGFRGASAQTLRAIIDPLFGAEQQVSFTDTDWVEEQISSDIDVRTLASYLDQPLVPLKLAHELFLQTFIGAAP